MLYKKDSNGNIRTWRAEIEGSRYRFHTGVEDGAIVTSGWQYASGKNIGKANATTDGEQAALEINSKQADKLSTGGYYETRQLALENKPKFFEPMLAQKYNNKKVVFPCLSQPKYDGMRCIATRSGLFSRRGKPILTGPHISQYLEDKGFWDDNPDVDYLDGELYNHELADDFDKIMSIARKSKPTAEHLAEAAEKLRYYVYDIPSNKSTSLRIDSLRNIISDSHPVFSCPTAEVNDQNELDTLYAEYLEAGYEGQMLRYESPYEVGKRSKSLLKRKEFVDDEFEIVEIVEGLGNWAGRAKSVMIKLPDGQIQHSGMRGNFDFTKKLLEEKDEYVGGEVTVRYQNKTPDGILRFPVAVDWHKNGRQD